VVLDRRALAAATRPPARARLLPVVRDDSVLPVGADGASIALDHHALAGLAADQKEQHRPRDRRGLQQAMRLLERLAGVESPAQQVLGWQRRRAQTRQ